MAIIKENYLIPLNRMLFISKDGLKLEDIIVKPKAITGCLKRMTIL